MIIMPILSVKVVVIKKAMIAQFIAMMFITIAKTVADIIEWILKTRQRNTSLSYRYHVLIAELKCKGRFIKLPRHFHTLLKFRMEKNHILD